jgi:hypothetical protein
VLYLHIYKASYEEGYEYHHRTDVNFECSEDLLMGCISVIKNMHHLFRQEVDIVTMENKTMCIEEKDTSGIMFAASNIPFSCFAEGALLDTDSVLMFDADNTSKHLIEVLGC